MADKLTQLSCKEFVNILATKEPVPGGGGTAALVGALGVALGNMVGSLTVGKKKYAEVEPELLALKAKSGQLQEQLLAMVEKDAEAFAPLSKAYCLPAETEEQKTAKAQVMEGALRVAAAAPLEIMELCMDALKMIERFAQIGSRLAVSDAGRAATCIRAALNAASLNVRIHTQLMKDRTVAEEMNERTEFLLRNGTVKADAIFEMVQAQLI